jgi:hypothetical protein
MGSPGELRLISALCDGSVEAIQPNVTRDEGIIEYPNAQDLLDEYDHPIIDTLESLVERGILDRSYMTKRYLCPSCRMYWMYYIGACPACGSLHTSGRVIARHQECGYSSPAHNFEHEDGSQVCPGCSKRVSTSSLEYSEKHVCRTCDELFSEPEHRIRCRVCLKDYLPKQVLERTLYEYTVTDHGRAWYHIQMMTRDELVSYLEKRNFETRLNVSLTTSEPYPVHVYGEHALMDRRVAARIYDEVEVDDLHELQTAATRVAAHPLVVLTNRSISEEIRDLLIELDMKLLTVQPDGTLDNTYNVHEESATENHPI